MSDGMQLFLMFVGAFILSLPILIPMWIILTDDTPKTPPGSKRRGYRNHYGIVPSSMQDDMGGGE